MTGEHAAAAAGNDLPGIRSVLVRQLPSGHVLRCGTVHNLQAGRGDTLVIQTTTGRWLATLLIPAAGEGRRDEPLGGEWLRVAGETDRRRGQAAQQRAAELFDAASQTLQQAGAQLVLAAAEVDLGGDVGVLRFLGPASERLGPWAVELAERCGLGRVQWVSLEAERPAESSTSSEQLHEEAFQRRFADVTRPGPELGMSLGKDYRVSAGNRGWYQQKRRGESPRLRRLPAGRSWMVRVRTAAGGMAAAHLRQLARLAAEFGDGTLRLTIRQAIQLHGVDSQYVPQVIERLESSLLSTAGSCGDAVRNLTCCSLPLLDAADRWPGQAETRHLALQLGQAMLPRGLAFEWTATDGEETIGSGPPAAEPLPHKFKIGVASDRHDCADVLSNDLAVIVRTEASCRPAAVDLYVGGSTAYRAGDARSFPRLAQYLATVAYDDCLPAAEMLLGMFSRRDTPGPRHFRRWKYVVARSGVETLYEQLCQQASERTDVRRDADAAQRHLARTRSVHPPGGRTAEGHLWFRLPLVAGRLTAQHMPLLDDAAAAGATVRVGTDHDLIVSYPPGSAGAGRLAQWTPRHAFGRTADPQQFDQPPEPQPAGGNAAGRVCPALPTCPLAVAAAETQWDMWSDALRAAFPPEEAFDAGGSSGVFLALSGCANGCSRPLTAPVGVVAESPGRRVVYLGGSSRRLGQAVGAVAGPEELTLLLRPILARFGRQRAAGESFGDWFWRTCGK
ncbi:assimilatory sulfite reductase (NADPH) hemoprotein subunit [Roseimaritima sediminicola]|uniref:hypothetical protein n=1 Tax=Roseimaritima sediminicola TaxID=2662066 RepID=UPI001298538B|nr:hypothetical protein [Roseimaritima sediminicola]